MTSNKLIDLLKTLTKSEKAAFMQFLKERLSPKLEKSTAILFTLIAKKQFNNANYYVKCYEKKYDKKQDYLIRNDFRRITGAFKMFIENIDTENNENDILFFNFLIQKGLHQQVNSFYKNSTQKLAAGKNYAQHIQFIEAYINYIQQQELATSKKFKNLIQLNEEKKKLLIAQFSTQFRTTELNNVFLKRNYQAYFPDYKIELAAEQITINTTQNTYDKYLYLKAKNYLLKGNIKINWLQKCITFLIKHEQELNEQTNVNNELLVLKASVALAYFLMNKFEKSYNTYTEILTLFDNKKVKSPNKPAIIFNFITTCLKLGKYKVALLTIENNLKDLSSIPAFSLKIICILNMCYLMVNKAAKINIDELEKLLHQQIELSEKIYVRLIIAIYYFSISKKDLAENEIQNCYQFIHHHKELKNYNKLILVLKKVMEDEADFDIEKEIAELKINFNNTQINLPILWMEKYLLQQ